MNIQNQIKDYKTYNEQEEKDKEMILNCLKQYDNLLERTNEIAHFTASSWILNQRKDKILMIYHNILDSWAWTGGHADGNQELLQVAIKEAIEETGIVHVKPLSESIYSMEVLPVPGHVKRGVYVSSHVHLNVTYLLEADDTDDLRIKEDENKGVAWFPIQEAPNQAKDALDIFIYRKLNDKLEKYLI